MSTGTEHCPECTAIVDRCTCESGEESNLSDEIWEDYAERGNDCLTTEKVKEFIRLLKEGVKPEHTLLLEKIDKLAGDKLI